MPETTYINGYHPSVLATHNARTAQNSCQFLLPTLSTLSTSHASFSLLDAGCGPASITISLAFLFPAAKITALDLSSKALEPGRHAAKQQNVTNVNFKEGDVYALPFPDESFDVVHAQQLLCHLPDPIKAIAELLRVTKKGGVLALREADTRAIFFYPELPLLKKNWELFAKTIEGEGNTGNASAGRKLRRWVRSAGVKEEEMKCSAGTWCYSSEVERVAFGKAWMERVVGIKVVEQGLATKQEMAEIREGWKEWSQDPDGWLCIPHGEALITVI
ncbi:hypothetical protein E4T47_09438 [Aureobasidium subglaciale]|nr:hypothetical protein E4T47_09438 [Aureobasidium subglaciale]